MTLCLYEPDLQPSALFSLPALQEASISLDEKTDEVARLLKKVDHYSLAHANIEPLLGTAQSEAEKLKVCSSSRRAGS